MIKIRGYYEKIDRMRFIGHLDLLKLFQRAIARAGIPVAYSNGFNPHQLVGFALPLSTGYAGLNEIIEIDLTEPVDETAVMRDINNFLPEGIRIKEFITLGEGDKKAASLVAGAVYEVSLPSDADFGGLGAVLEEMKAAAEIITEKDDGTEINIKPLVSDITLLGDRCIEFVSAAGSFGSVKPEYVMKAVFRLCGVDFQKNKYALRYTRKALHLSGNGEKK